MGTVKELRLRLGSAPAHEEGSAHDENKWMVLSEKRLCIRQGSLGFLHLHSIPLISTRFKLYYILFFSKGVWLKIK